MATFNRQKIDRITIYAMLTALIILMTFTPLGYITTPALAITLIHLPVIIAAVTLGIPGGAGMGAVWGITCVIKAVIAPPSPLEGIMFRNPLVAILPRVLAGLLAGIIFQALDRGGKKQENNQAKPKHGKTAFAAGAAALGGALTNTIVTLTALYALYHAEIGLGELAHFGGLTKFIGAAFAINAPLEIAAAVLLAVPVSVAVKQAMKRV